MSLRPLFATLIAFAMLFAPLALQSGAAMAMGPADQHAQKMMKTGNCDEKPAKGDLGKSTDKPCCAAMCTTVAVNPTASVAPHTFARSVERPALDQFGHGYLASLPTPPPRRA